MVLSGHGQPFADRCRIPGVPAFQPHDAVTHQLDQHFAKLLQVGFFLPLAAQRMGPYRYTSGGQDRVHSGLCRNTAGRSGTGTDDVPDGLGEAGGVTVFHHKVTQVRLSHAGNLEVQLAQQKESGGQVEACLERKRALYERFVLKEIDADAFKAQKAVLDGELAQLKQVHAAVTAQVERTRGDEKTKRARTELAREITGVSGLTAGLVDTLIDRVYVSPGNQVEIVWKMKDFCMKVV